MDGFDFDLEGDAIKGSDSSWTSQMQDLIGKMHEYANSEKMKDKFPRGFFITAAPQTYFDTGVPVSIYWTSTGGRYNIFKDMLPMNACGCNICFDELLINRNAPGWPNEAPTLSIKIAADTLKAANNTKTKIVIGDVLLQKAAMYHQKSYKQHILQMIVKVLRLIVIITSQALWFGLLARIHQR